MSERRVRARGPGLGPARWAWAYLMALALVAFSRGAVAAGGQLGEAGSGRVPLALCRSRPDEQAMASGDSSVHRSLLQGKGKPNKGGKDRAVWDAAADGDVPALEAAISNGGSVETRHGAFGDTPLTIASARGFLQAVEVLLAEGADPDVGDLMFDAAPIWWGALEDHLDVVQLLIESGAEVDRADLANITAIEVAAQNGNAEIVAVLLDAGADGGHVDAVGDTALHFASVTLGDDSLRIIELLVESGAPLDAASADGSTPLMWAAEFGNVPAVRLLLKLGAEVGLEDHEGKTAAEKVCACLEFANSEILLQCPEGGCDSKSTARKIGNLLKK